MASLSVIIIAKDETTNIRRCVESVKWADEIVVVDSGSTDGTPEICRELGCRVLYHTWQGYARQKNFALDHAKGEWVLSLDADEEVTSDLAIEMQDAIIADKAEAYSVPRRNLFIGRWMRYGGWYPDRQIRLFKRGVGRFKEVPLHEHIELCKDARVGLLSADLKHYTYPGIGHFIRKADQYTTIEAETLVMSNRAPKALALSLLFAVPLKFAEVYVWKQGWRDGLHGFVGATMMAFRVFMRHVKIWEMQKSLAGRGVSESG